MEKLYREFVRCIIMRGLCVNKLQAKSRRHIGGSWGLLKYNYRKWNFRTRSLSIIIIISINANR